MSLCPRWGLLPLLLLLWLGLPAAAHAAGGLEDGAGLFKPSTRDKATKAIEEIRRDTGKDLFIETVAKLPEQKLKEYLGLKTPAERARFFRAFAEQRAAQRPELDGVYVLLCGESAVEEPRGDISGWFRRTIATLRSPHVAGRAVVVWPASNDAYFPEGDRATLSAKFGKIDVFKGNQDPILLEAIEFTGKVLKRNARELQAPPANTFRWTDVLWAAAALVAAWVVLSIARARVAARQGTSGPVPGANVGLAPLFGAAGALWVFEAYRAARAEAAAPPAAEPAPAPDEIPAGGPMHPDDLEAIARGPEPWAHEDTEATSGHDLP
ncbi:MAG TPA: TPM domain-containing protein [Gemmataceae bacterium]|nr:TPM domain-containing protein [Gemmataceae bacterium]